MSKKAKLTKLMSDSYCEEWGCPERKQPGVRRCSKHHRERLKQKREEKRAASENFRKAVISRLGLVHDGLQELRDEETDPHRLVTIYCIGNTEEGYVKFGYTTTAVTKRLGAIQTGCPFEVGCIGNMELPLSYERRIHNRLKEWHSYGEWFHVKGDVPRMVEAFGKADRKSVESMIDDAVDTDQEFSVA